MEHQDCRKRIVGPGRVITSARRSCQDRIEFGSATIRAPGAYMKLSSDAEVQASAPLTTELVGGVREQRIEVPPHGRVRTGALLFRRASREARR
jgi:hypothetical protein